MRPHATYTALTIYLAFLICANALAWAISSTTAGASSATGGWSRLQAGVQHQHRAACEHEVAQMIHNMTLDEKAAQLNTWAGSVKRLDIPDLNWWTEGIHGLNTWEEEGGTLYPVPLAFGATFDPDLVYRIATAVSDEARAYYNRRVGRGQGPAYLNVFGPNINNFRDPRWGRGLEVYGEDPTLLARMAVAFVRGMQGDHPKYVKVGATCKHFAAYSLEQAEGLTRHNYNALVDDRDLAESYLPHFAACVREGGVRSIMCSYNRVNGVPACAHPRLLDSILRTTWGFTGFVVSDCGAVTDVALWHKYVPGRSIPRAVANTTTAGCDLNCDGAWGAIPEAVNASLLAPEALDRALTRVLGARCERGALHPQPPQDMPWRDIGMDVVGSPAHAALALEAGRKSIVLLHNAVDPVTGRPVLPLDVRRLSRLAVGGPLADRGELLLGTYYQRPAGNVTTPVAAIREYLANRTAPAAAGAAARTAAGGVEVDHWVAGGSDVVYPFNLDGLMGLTDSAAAADVTVLFMGSSSMNTGDDGRLITPVVESEGLDRVSLTLPQHQEEIVQAAARGGKPVVVVLIHGGPVDFSPLLRFPNVVAVLSAWYPGQAAAAIPEILFGDVSPSGRLPVTFYFDNYTRQSSETDMSMRKWPGRTYKYVQVPVLRPFGFGLSYIDWRYTDARAGLCSGGAGGAPPVPGCIRISFTLANAGPMAGDEVVMAFLQRGTAATAADAAGAGGVGAAPGGGAGDPPPRSLLVAMKRVTLEVGESASLSFDLLPTHAMHADARGRPVLAAGPVTLQIGPLLLNITLPEAPEAAAGATTSGGSSGSGAEPTSTTRRRLRQRNVGAADRGAADDRISDHVIRDHDDGVDYLVASGAGALLADKPHIRVVRLGRAQ